MLTSSTNLLNKRHFHQYNVQWIAAGIADCSVKEYAADTLRAYLLNCVMHENQKFLDAQKVLNSKSRIMTRGEGCDFRTQRAVAQQRLQVYVPALRRLDAWLRMHALGHARMGASKMRLSSFLLGMLAQTDLFPMRGCVSAPRELPKDIYEASASISGLTQVQQQAALNVLKDNSDFFATLPAWIDTAVGASLPTIRAIKTALQEAERSELEASKKHVRAKIVDAGILTKEESELLLRFL